MSERKPGFLKSLMNAISKFIFSDLHDELENEIIATQRERYAIEPELRRVTLELQDANDAIADLNETIRTLTDDVEESAEQYRQLKRSEEAYADNLELLKSSIEDTILAAQPEGGYTSAEMQSAARALAEKLLRETERAVHAKLNSQNFPASKKKLEATFDFVARHGVAFTQERRAQTIEDLKSAYEHEVKRELEKEEQARIRALVREEAKLELERAREIKRLADQEAAIQSALQRELARANDEHSAIVELLKAQLAEAHARTERAVSQAQLTKAGNIYVISNIGSFGEDVYKVGMTRRLEPLDRVRELGDASVPFPFDVHMMISCTDAPTLENALHKELHKHRVNRVNPRKEFFKVELARIAQIVEEYHGKIEFITDPEAEQYRNSLIITDEEEDYVDSILEPLAEIEVE